MDSSRNTDEFVRLFSLWTNSIYSYVHVLVPSHADAEDIFQEVSRTLWQKFGEYEPGTDEGFRAWALRIAQIEVLRFRQREGRRHKLFNDHIHNALNDVLLASLDAIDPRLEALGDCYRQLSDDDQSLINARYRIGSTVEAIARQMGRSVHATYRSLRRIHQSLFECIETKRGQSDRPANRQVDDPGLRLLLRDGKEPTP